MRVMQLCHIRLARRSSSTGRYPRDAERNSKFKSPSLNSGAESRAAIPSPLNVTTVVDRRANYGQARPHV